MKSSKKTTSGGASKRSKVRVERPPGYYVAAAKVHRAMKAAISVEEVDVDLVHAPSSVDSGPDSPAGPTVNDMCDGADQELVEKQDGLVSDQSQTEDPSSPSSHDSSRHSLENISYDEEDPSVKGTDTGMDRQVDGGVGGGHSNGSDDAGVAGGSGGSEGPGASGVQGTPGGHPKQVDPTVSTPLAGHMPSPHADLSPPELTQNLDTDSG